MIAIASEVAPSIIRPSLFPLRRSLLGSGVGAGRVVAEGTSRNPRGAETSQGDQLGRKA